MGAESSTKGQRNCSIHAQPDFESHNLNPRLSYQRVKPISTGPDVTSFSHSWFVLSHSRFILRDYTPRKCFLTDRQSSRFRQSQSEIGINPLINPPPMSSFCRSVFEIAGRRDNASYVHMFEILDATSLGSPSAFRSTLDRTHTLPSLPPAHPSPPSPPRPRTPTPLPPRYHSVTIPLPPCYHSPPSLETHTSRGSTPLIFDSTCEVHRSYNGETLRG